MSNERVNLQGRAVLKVNACGWVVVRHTVLGPGVGRSMIVQVPVDVSTVSAFMRICGC